MSTGIDFAAMLETRAVLGVTGPDARGFLQGLITNDMEKVSRERAVYAALLTPQGKFLFDFFVIEHGGGFWLDCAAAGAQALLKRLTLYRLRAQVSLSEETELAVAAAAGGPLPGSPENAAPGTAWPIGGSGGGEGVAFADPRLRELGCRLVAPRPVLEAVLGRPGVALADATAYDRHRLALGVPEGGTDIEPERSFLLESNFDELNGVDFRKGCYVGQELTARTKHRGTIRKRLVPVNLSGPLPAPGTPVTAGGTALGEMRSGRDGRAIALIRLDRYAAARAAGHNLKAGEAELTPDPPPWLAPVLEAAAEGPAEET